MFHLFLPDTTGSFPLVIFIHVADISNSPDIVINAVDRQLDIKYFLENGMAYASVGYRLINNLGPGQKGDQV